MYQVFIIKPNHEYWNDINQLFWTYRGPKSEPYPTSWTPWLMEMFSSKLQPLNTPPVYEPQLDASTAIDRGPTLSSEIFIYSL